MRRTIAVVGVVVLAMVVAPCVATAQQWCYDACYPTTDCDQPSWLSEGNLGTCGDWGTAAIYTCCSTWQCGGQMCDGTPIW